MSEIFKHVVELVEKGEVVISDHGYDELAADGLFARDMVGSVANGAIVEEYPDYPKGPCVLLLQQGRGGERVHVVWGIPRGESSPAVLVTAYRPDPERWEPSLLRRKR